MAVYRHNYRAYNGPLTSTALRFLVIPRYAYQRVFASRLFLALFLACLLPPLGGGVLIYLHHNVRALQILQLPLDELVPINGQFFLVLLWIQSFFGFVITTLIGPGLVSPDLTNNALPLYLSRPLTRWDYVIGKMAVLLFLLSAITWIPLMLLFLFQAKMQGIGWLLNNLDIGVAILAGAWLWMLVMSLLALALSAWVRWRPVAGALIFGVFVVGGGFGSATNAILYTRWGDLMNIGRLIHTAWSWLFTGQILGGESIPVWSAFAGLLAICGICLWLLSTKLKAYEVVRS